MTDIGKKLGFNSHEQQAASEEKQVLQAYESETKTSFTALRNVAWLIDSQMILEEDGFVQPTAVEPAPVIAKNVAQVATNVVSMASRQEQNELSEQERMLAEARERAQREAA